MTPVRVRGPDESLVPTLKRCNEDLERPGEVPARCDRGVLKAVVVPENSGTSQQSEFATATRRTTSVPDPEVAQNRRVNHVGRTRPTPKDRAWLSRIVARVSRCSGLGGLVPGLRGRYIEHVLSQFPRLVPYRIRSDGQAQELRQSADAELAHQARSPKLDGAGRDD